MCFIKLDTVDRALLISKLKNLGFKDNKLRWFVGYTGQDVGCDYKMGTQVK